MRGGYFKQGAAAERDQAGWVRGRLRAACDVVDNLCGWDLASTSVLFFVCLLSFAGLLLWLFSQWWAAVPIVLPLPFVELVFRMQADVLK